MTFIAVRTWSPYTATTPHGCTSGRLWGDASPPTGAQQRMDAPPQQ
jgi:hypothetical protein